MMDCPSPILLVYQIQRVSIGINPDHTNYPYQLPTALDPWLTHGQSLSMSEYSYQSAYVIKYQRADGLASSFFL
jgi:hypothetical protein